MDSSYDLTPERRARLANQNPIPEVWLLLSVPSTYPNLELSGMRAREDSVHMKSCD